MKDETLGARDTCISHYNSLISCNYDLFHPISSSGKISCLPAQLLGEVYHMQAPADAGAVERQGVGMGGELLNC